MIVAYYFFSALLVFLSYKSFLGGLAYRRYFREKLHAKPAEFHPFASVIAPCRGVDEDFSTNLDRLFVQDYPAYEIIFVVDDESDAAVPYIRESIDKNTQIPARIVVAPKATENAQKAENLRTAVQDVDDESEILVFVDSDARVSTEWLRWLVSPLADTSVGAATGYRWFVSHKASLANELLSTWNASIASALGPNRKSNFTWGGSTAIRRDTFNGLGIREKWRGIVAEDFVLANAALSAGLQIEFVPQALCASPADVSVAQLWEFTTRQMKITRVYRPDLWAMSLVGSALFCSVILSSLMIALFANDSVQRIVAIVTLLVVSAFSVHKSLTRVLAVSSVIPGSITFRHRITHVLLFAATPPIFLANCIAGIFSRVIVWRGTHYKMVSPTQTIVKKAK